MKTAFGIQGWLVLLMLGLGACTTVEFEGTDNRIDAMPQDISRSGQLPAGRTVVWGGRVLEVANLESGTELLILAYPLSGGNVPRIESSSVGRFVAVYPGYLETQDFTPMRHVTLAGKLSSLTENWSFEGVPVKLPQVAVQGIHLWPLDPATWQTRLSLGLSIGIYR
jgi:outer membrane lipoprotein